MSKNELPVSFFSVLRDLVEWVRTQRVPGVLIGGIAASLLGRPRVTRDIDMLLLLDEENWGRFLDGGKAFGFVPRIKDCLKFAEKSRVLLIRHAPSGIDLDIVLGLLPFERETVVAATWVDVGGFSVPLPTVEDLVVMKALAHRPRDLADIEGLADANPHMDTQKILALAGEFAEALDEPDILESLRRIIGGRGKKK